MIIHLPSVYAGLAQYGRLARPIDDIVIVCAVDIDPFLSFRNPLTATNIRHIKECVAYGIVDAEPSSEHPEAPLFGTFTVKLSDEDENLRPVDFLWTLGESTVAADGFAAA